MPDEDELDDGYVLTCVAYPREPFTLETGETPDSAPRSVTPRTVRPAHLR